MKVTYKCKECEKIFTKDFEGKPDFSVKCECGGKAPRVYGDITIDTPVESASGATRMMLFSKDNSNPIV